MKILLAVCGSISAYKSIDLARALVNRGHQVKVVLTAGSLNFVVPDVYSYLGVEKVYQALDDFNHKNVLHVELARWADSLVIAPISANTISRLSRGEASDLLTSVFLAFESTKPILIFPAMNTQMLKHPFTQENIEQIKKIKTLNNVFVADTNVGVLACNDVGEGKLASVEEMVELIPILKTPFIHSGEQKKIVISAGATIAPLDPVRYLTNSSSGITGFYLAKSALARGYKVVVIAGKNATNQLELLNKHPNFKLIRIITVNEMHDSVHTEVRDAHAYLSAAAISDWEFDVSENKLKKDQAIDVIKLKKAPDILKSVINSLYPHLKIVGFAAETELTDEYLQKKFDAKPVDLLVGTKVHNGLFNNAPEIGFAANQAQYRFVEADLITNEHTIDKEELGDIILQRLKL